ncbi:hypothetical protein C8A00DRAFT_19041 [Chaetomidium leptoderma]|uniref:Uncharacterized protein n=1 Tax=Chaetomidium leptoderma TaxID=669021 RepID=A0AAN6ZT37_9PEZI|nr:hypothetical protein C8A00DRAFT_19041 [Chaetomidium leptoderma]
MNTYAWNNLGGGVRSQASQLEELGLAPWDELQPMVRERFTRWSPVARQLWESEFVDHRNSLVRAWIWHYLDDNLFSFSGGEDPGALVPFSPVWEHVRALRRHLDVLRTTRYEDIGHALSYPIKVKVWSQLTDRLVREGLGLKTNTTAANLIPHYKRSVRLLLADGEAKIPDQWYDYHFDPTGITSIDCGIKRLLENALNLQYFIHGMVGFGSYTLRFTPIGSDKLWGFPFDKDWMELNNVMELPDERPGEALPDVQLVSDPMMVVSGLDGQSYDRKFEVWTRMQVVTPWTFGGEEAEEHAFPEMKKGWRERLAREWHEKEAARVAARVAAEKAEASPAPEGATRPKRTKKIKKSNGVKRIKGPKGGKGGRGAKGAKGAEETKGAERAEEAEEAE